MRRRGSGLDAAHHTQTSRVSGTRGVTIRLSGWYQFLAILPLAHRVRRATRAHLSHPAPATKCGIFPADRNPLSPELRLSDPRPASTLCGCWQTEVAADAMVDSQATSTNRTLDLGSAHLRAEVSYVFTTRLWGRNAGLMRLYFKLDSARRSRSTISLRCSAYQRTMHA